MQIIENVQGQEKKQSISSDIVLIVKKQNNPNVKQKNVNQQNIHAIEFSMAVRTSGLQQRSSTQSGLIDIYRAKDRIPLLSQWNYMV